MCTHGKATHKNAVSACRLAALRNARNAWLFALPETSRC
jgi:hypothetical protein